MERALLFVIRLRRALRYYFGFRYTWRLSWHKAVVQVVDEHADTARAGTL